MVVFVYINVILEVVSGDPRWSDWSSRQMILLDVLIGAHALVENLALLSRDGRRYRQAFPGLKLISHRPDSTGKHQGGSPSPRPLRQRSGNPPHAPQRRSRSQQARPPQGCCTCQSPHRPTPKARLALLGAIFRHICIAMP
jgi:hypothetical protein